MQKEAKLDVKKQFIGPLFYLDFIKVLEF